MQATETAAAALNGCFELRLGTLLTVTVTAIGTGTGTGTATETGFWVRLKRFQGQCLCRRCRRRRQTNVINEVSPREIATNQR